jgi:hypothetical protein
MKSVVIVSSWFSGPLLIHPLQSKVIFVVVAKFAEVLQAMVTEGMHAFAWKNVGSFYSGPKSSTSSSAARMHWRTLVAALDLSNRFWILRFFVPSSTSSNSAFRSATSALECLMYHGIIW